MVKNMYVKGYTASKPQHGGHSRRKVIVTGALVLVALAAWLLWGEWHQQGVQPRLLPPVRNKIVRPIPSPLPGGGDDSEYIRFSSKKTDAPALERQLLMEADLPASSQETDSSASQESDGDISQTIAPTDARGERDSTAESHYVEPENEIAETVAPRDSTSKLAQEEFVIQVGAFRNLTAAESSKKALTDKGYDAYLEGQTLPELGLVHRVRIRGYTSVSEAKEDMERLYKEEGLNSFVLKIEPDSTTVSEK
jgi:cell division septation protein DedD